MSLKDCGMHSGGYHPGCQRCRKLNGKELVEQCKFEGYPYPLCVKAHETPEKMSNLIQHLVGRWGVDDPEIVIEEYGNQVVWNAAFRQRNSDLAKMDHPSSVFISQCRIAVNRQGDRGPD